MPIDNITIISLILSVTALGVAVTGSVLLHDSISKLGTLDSRLDAYVLVKEFSERIGRIEQRLVDQRVRFEVMELRSKRGNISTGIVGESRQFVRRGILAETDNVNIRKSSVTSKGPDVQTQVSGRKAKNLSRRDSTSLEREILRLVADRNGKVVAREIQLEIDRSREHTARLMNLLFKGGLVTRDASARPFTYSISDKGRTALEG